MIQPADPDGGFSGEKYTGGYIVGGPALVRDILGLERVYGQDRYATGQALLKTLSYEYDRAYIVDGQALTAALLAASLACRTNSPVILTPGGRFEAVSAGVLRADTRVYLIGTQ
jgi:hypothetical protein